MKNLNKNEVYSLDGITHEQAVELLEWLKENDVDWGDSYLSCIKSSNYLIFLDTWCYGSKKDVKPTTHISTLFTTELCDLIKQRDELNKKIEEYGKPKVGDVCKFWDGSTEESDGYVVSKLTNIHLGEDIRSPYKANINGTWFKNAKKLTEQEVIELLFKK